MALKQQSQHCELITVVGLRKNFATMKVIGAKESPLRHRSKDKVDNLVPIPFVEKAPIKLKIYIEAAYDS